MTKEFNIERDEQIDWLHAGMLKRAAWVALNADRIYVRVQVKGGWKNVALVDLPDGQKITETRRLIARDVEPHMVIK